MVEKVAKRRKKEPIILTKPSVLKWLNGAKKSGLGAANSTPAKDSAGVFDKVPDAVSNVLNSTKHPGPEPLLYCDVSAVIFGTTTFSLGDHLNKAFDITDAKKIL